MSGRLVLKRVEDRYAHGGGQGGGGGLSREELLEFVLRPGSGEVPLLRRGTIVHTDGAKASLGKKQKNIVPTGPCLSTK